MEIVPIAFAHNGYKEKFGIPRQSGRAASVITRIVMTKQFGTDDSVRGIQQFSHIWLIWGFSENHHWSPTVRPPRLGGNKRIGVFATRSSFRPNSLALSVVKLISVEKNSNGEIVLVVGGADMMDNTPIFDIKPYIPYADCVSNALGGFASAGEDYRLEVEIPQTIMNMLSEQQKQDLTDILAQDPRPAYHNDQREYGLTYDNMNVKFKVIDGVLYVTDCKQINDLR